jgi:transcriptional antiterminator NusG
MALRWYVVHVHSGYENKIKESLLDLIEKKGFQESFGEILIPSHEVTEVRRGKKYTREKNFFPGYILIQMDLTDQAWHAVKSINKVSGFLGTKDKPSPISKKEAERLMQQVEEGVETPMSDLIFEIGEQVKVSDGPFATFSGVVEEVDSDKCRLKVSVSIFGRSTPVDLDYTQVEKV